MATKDVRDVLSGPIAQELLYGNIPARLAYIALDGTPRAIPMGFWWDGQRILMFTIPDSPKDAALRANPAVALTIDTNDAPQKVLLIRGVATVDLVDGIPEDYLKASFKLIPEDHQQEFVDGVTALYSQMVRISVEPTWATSFDFVTSIPQAAQKKVDELKTRLGHE